MERTRLFIIVDALVGRSVHGEHSVCRWLRFRIVIAHSRICTWIILVSSQHWLLIHSSIGIHFPFLVVGNHLPHPLHGLSLPLSLLCFRTLFGRQGGINASEKERRYKNGMDKAFHGWCLPKTRIWHSNPVKRDDCESMFDVPPKRNVTRDSNTFLTDVWKNRFADFGCELQRFGTDETRTNELHIA